MKQQETQQQIDSLLRGLFTRVPFLKLQSLRTQVTRRRAGEIQHWADAVLKVTIDRLCEWTLVAEAENSGQPQIVRAALLRLQHALSLLPPKTRRYGILLAPFISPASAQLCAKAGIGYADLAGNCRLSFAHIYIETRAADNPFHEKRTLKSIFTPKATRILRVLLQGPLRPWKVKELAAAADVSLGHVSDVRQQLLAQEWAAEEAAGGLLVTRPADLLDAWAAADRWEDRTTVRDYSLLHTDPADIATRVHQLLGHQPHAFTQWIAATQRHPYTTVPLTTVYVAEFPEEDLLKSGLLARRVEGGAGGGRLRLVRPKDAGVLHPQQTVNGLPLVGDVQIYLDLLRAGMRGDEAAAELRRWPDFSGCWPASTSSPSA
ncbi:hypothetical protein [Prosthecobacter sp.]|uniref:hypothetical protein n=1 Tax=Prosthecobacter sp. TaxID=1965333 RepID=UPI0037838B63